MEKNIQADNLIEQFNNDIKEIKNLNDLNNLKITYLGKKGYITELSSVMKDLDIEQRKTFGSKLNELRDTVNSKLDTLKEELELSAINKKLENETIDVTLPGVKIKSGTSNPLQKVVNEIEELFISMGYDVKTGPEVELDLYNFELLNLPKGNPVRDAQDSFYITDDILLRTQTSPVQIRTMLENKEKTPLRIICPGKTYRRDEDDASHSHQFMQIEGLLIDENISLADLKGTVDIFAKKMFGENKKTRFRPSFYPFTEPSVEVDITCHKCNGEGCNVCKNTGWLTIMGAGMVHPKVLENGGYDSTKYTGFAFGMGAERIAMLKYGINDVRTLYTNDLRTLEQFNRIGENL